MRGPRWIFLVLLAMALCAGAALIGCGGDDDDDDSGDNDDDDSGDDDDSTDTTPVIDSLNPYYTGGAEGVYVGDQLNMNFHFTDADANLLGGSIYFNVAGEDVEPQEITYDPGEEGYIITSITAAETWPEGVSELAVYVVDAAGEQSNSITADVRVLPPNTPPSISNLRFDPDPACTDAGSVFTILFDYYDPDGNLDGGAMVISFDLGIPTAFYLPNGLGTEGTFGVDAYPTDDVPEGTTADISLQVSDARNETSELLEETITFSATGCEE